MKPRPIWDNKGVSSPSEIAEFLRARLDEATKKAERRNDLARLLRQQAELVAEAYGDPDPPEDDMKPADRLWWTASDAAEELIRVANETLADVESKRRRLARHVPTEDPLHGTLCSWCSVPQVSVYQAWPCADIRDDVAVYADHPNYRDEWRS